MTPTRILAGDVGGTKTVLAVFERSGERMCPRHVEVYPSTADTFETILAKFLTDFARPAFDAACFGVAGPVHDGVCDATNLPWTLSEKALSAYLDGRPVNLINDLVAASYGMLFLEEKDFEVINAGSPAKSRGNIAVVAPGTGLGEAILFWDGSGYRPSPSEGGHTSFAPQDEQEIELLRYMWKRYFPGHVSYERILSGDGFFVLYSFLRDTGFAKELPSTKQEMEAGDANATVSKLGLAGTDPLCTEAVRMFANILGAEAANLALKCLATSGVIIGGGIPPKILPALRTGQFMDGFTDKGRFESWLAHLPVKVALEPRAPLIGAANFLC